MAIKKIQVINTGGTIGMVHTERDNPLSPLRPAISWEEIAKNHPVLQSELLKVDTSYYQFDPLLDSSDINFKNWIKMAEVISESYQEHDGFVLLHGTDTMCYTASALSFIFEHLGKPVIITGSQVPMVEPRSDAVQNLVTAIRIASETTPLVPEVGVFFRDYLIRGNRSRKLSSSGYSGFKSPNYPYLAEAGEKLKYSTKFIANSPKTDQDFFINTFLDAHVMVLEIFPGFDPQILRNIFKEPAREEDRIKALVLKTFGAGNAPGSREFLSAIDFVSKQGTIIVDVTQCPEGTVELGLYEASSGLLNRGVISAVDMTPEAAVSKLMYLLGKGWPKEEVKRVFQLNLRGEQSLNIYNIDFDQPEKADHIFSINKTIPGEIDFSNFESASFRFHDVKFISNHENETEIKMKIFINHPNADENIPDKDPRLAGTIVRKLDDPGSVVDLFCDVKNACRKLVKPGQMANISVVVEKGKGVQWEKMSLSIFTSTL